jgi:hypothetical protein
MEPQASGSDRVTFTAAQPADLDDIIRLENACFSPANRASPDIIRERYRRYPGALLAHVGGSLAGYATFAPVSEGILGYIAEHQPLVLPPDHILPRSPLCCFFSFGVERQHRAAGLGGREARLSLLLCGAIGYAAQAGGSTELLYILENDGMRRQALAAGARPVCEYARDGIMTTIARLPLAGNPAAVRGIALFEQAAQGSPAILEQLRSLAPPEGQ